MTALTQRFGKCEICSRNEWSEVYRGPIRDGTFGKLSDPDTVIAECKRCGAQRLEEKRCQSENAYEGEGYRRLIGERTDSVGYLAEHDVRMLQNLVALWPQSLRDKKLADVGCAAGSFLDHVRGLVNEAVAIEPCQIYHGSLAQRGYEVYDYSKEAMLRHKGSFDFVCSWEVIEHVPDPRMFLHEIRELLKPEGRVMISTPNRRDILMDLLPDDYRQFFYRVVHRWYFDEASFRHCAEQAGFKVLKTKFVQRFGLSNALRWLRDRQPGGREALPHLDSPLIDKMWCSYLEDRGVADYLYFALAPADR